MKKLSLLILVFGLNFVVFGQKSLTAVAPSNQELISGIQSGHIQMTLPSEISEENVIMYSKYYTNIFTVDFDAKTNIASFHMLSNDANSRRVILRFLSANQIVSVQVDSMKYDLGTFFDKYLND